MSTRCRTYIMIGALLDYKDAKAILEKDGGEAYDKLEPLIDIARAGKVGSFGCIFDGMNGKYIALGKIIAAGEDDQGLEHPVAIDPLPDDEMDKLKGAIATMVPGMGFSVQPWVIHHWH